MDKRKMIAVSPETWARLKKLQVERIAGRTAPTLGALVEMGLEAIELLADLVEVINSEDGPPFQEPLLTLEEQEWLERAEAMLKGGKI